MKIETEIVKETEMVIEIEIEIEIGGKNIQQEGLKFRYG